MYAEDERGGKRGGVGEGSYYRWLEKKWACSDTKTDRQAEGKKQAEKSRHKDRMDRTTQKNKQLHWCSQSPHGICESNAHTLHKYHTEENKLTSSPSAPDRFGRWTSVAQIPALHMVGESETERQREREKGRYEKQERENLLHIGTQWHADQRVCREVRGGKGMCECVCVFVMGGNKGGGQSISICAEQTVNSIDRDVLPCVRSSFRFC